MPKKPKIEPSDDIVRGTILKYLYDAWKNPRGMESHKLKISEISYQEGIRKTFKNWGSESKVKHISILGKRKIVNNNAIENHHTHQKEFHKIRRGVNDVQNYQDGFKIYHNFIRKGVEDKKTPAERCGIGLNGNRWHTLLLNSIKQQKATNLTSEDKINESH